MTQWSESLLDVCVANAPVNFQTVTRTIQFIRNQWFLTVWIKGVHEMPQRNDERTTDWITYCSFSRENLNIYIWCNSMYYFLSWGGNTFRCISFTDHSLIYAVRMINSLPKCNGKGKSKLEISKTLTVNFFSKTYKLNPGRIYLFTKLMWLQCGAFGRLCSLKCSTDTPLSGQKVWEMGPAFRVV